MAKRKQSSGLLYGVVVGLLTFSLVSLIGMVFRVEPYVIVQRALTATAITSVAAWINARLIMDNLVTK